MTHELQAAPAGRIVTLSADAAALRSLKDWALTTLQTSEERIPASHAKLIPAALRAAKRMLFPADPKLIGVEVAKLEEWAAAFNMPEADWKSATTFYRESLGHLPADLLTEAFKGIRATHKWGMRLPLPSEIMSQVSDQLAERRTLITKLEMALRCPVESEQPPPTPEERKRVADLLANWRSNRTP